MEIKKLSNNIRRIRVLNGLTQENVANDLGISLTAYGKIEQAKTDISFSRLCQIAEYFKIKPAALLEEVYAPNTAEDSQNYQFKDSRIGKVEKDVEDVKIMIKSLERKIIELNTKQN
jgi:transcriptional regulator with XRE-family HTH domain